MSSHRAQLYTPSPLLPHRSKEPPENVVGNQILVINPIPNIAWGSLKKKRKKRREEKRRKKKRKEKKGKERKRKKEKKRKEKKRKEKKRKEKRRNLRLPWPHFHQHNQTFW
jgi:cell division ATPase FtsA